MKISLFVEQLIKEASFLKVSDIHFHPNREKVDIYYRFLDKLVYQQTIDKQIYSRLSRYIKFKAKLDISQVRYPQDGSYKIKNIENKEETFIRISTIPLLNGESIVIRLLKSQEQLDFNDIAYNTTDLEEMYKTILNENGLFIFTGPTGSGKTTTMYQILNKIAIKDNQKIITIENPVEILNEKFIQMQINEDIGIDYSVCLKASLRQDPNIIMIGEIRDEETARNVFRAALTGHTVISTMHTKDKFGVIKRFKDFGFLESEINSVLIGISNQRLINYNEHILSIYDYSTGNNLQKLIRGEEKDYGIEKVLKKFNSEKISFKKN